MKILLVNNHHSKVGGAETVFFNTIELLLDYGHDVITLGRKNEKTIKTKAKEYFIDYTNSFLERLYSFRAKKAIQEIIDSEKPDIAHIHNIVGGITFSILPVLKKARIPIVMTIHDFRILCPAGLFLNSKNEICEKCGKGNYFQCILHNCSRKGFASSVGVSLETYYRNKFIELNNYCDHLVFVSSFSKNKFLEHYKSLSVDSSIINNPVTLNKFEKKRGDYFLFIGRIAQEKGIITLLQTFANLPQLELRIVGDGPLLPYCKEIATSNIKFLGYLSGNELAEQIRNAFFNIVPSECYETLSLSAVESLSASKPIIAANVGALKEVVDNKRNGFLFEPKSTQQLTKIITHCNSLSDEEYFSMCENAYLSSCKYEKNIYYEKIYSVYKAILGKYN